MNHETAGGFANSDSDQAPLRFPHEGPNDYHNVIVGTLLPDPLNQKPKDNTNGVRDNIMPL